MTEQMGGIKEPDTLYLVWDGEVWNQDRDREPTTRLHGKEAESVCRVPVHGETVDKVRGKYQVEK